VVWELLRALDRGETDPRNLLVVHRGGSVGEHSLAEVGEIEGLVSNSENPCKECSVDELATFHGQSLMIHSEKNPVFEVGVPVGRPLV
jgi:hypothetical protein